MISRMQLPVEIQLLTTSVILKKLTTSTTPVQPISKCSANINL
eukprot:XP_001707672.1 Hypothetical protein GL50803_29161 [Giardia lamblia ATCC 50803]